MGSSSNHFRSTAFAFLVVLTFVWVVSPVIARPVEGSDEKTTLSRFHRIAVSTLGYVHDNDGVMPLAHSFDNNSRIWRLSSYTVVPEGWTDSAERSKPKRIEEDHSMVLNAIRDYGAAPKDYEAAGMADFDVGFKSAARKGTLFKPTKVSVLYNGELHNWSMNAVATPSRLPLFTQGFKENRIGAGISFPTLCCTSIGPDCRFNPGGYPQGGQTSCAYYGPHYGDIWFISASKPNWSVWAYGHRLVFVRVDGSVESRKTEVPTWPKSSKNANDSPWSSFEGPALTGAPYWMTACVSPDKPMDEKSVYYMGYYRPDSKFDYRTDQCDFGTK